MDAASAAFRPLDSGTTGRDADRRRRKCALPAARLRDGHTRGGSPPFLPAVAALGAGHFAQVRLAMRPSAEARRDAAR